MNNVRNFLLTALALAASGCRGVQQNTAQPSEKGFTLPDATPAAWVFDRAEGLAEISQTATENGVLCALTVNGVRLWECVLEREFAGVCVTSDNMLVGYVNGSATSKAPFAVMSVNSAGQVRTLDAIAAVPAQGWDRGDTPAVLYHEYLDHSRLYVVRVATALEEAPYWRLYSITSEGLLDSSKVLAEAQFLGPEVRAYEVVSLVELNDTGALATTVIESNDGQYRVRCVVSDTPVSASVRAPRITSEFLFYSPCNIDTATLLGQLRAIRVEHCGASCLRVLGMPGIATGLLEFGPGGS